MDTRIERIFKAADYVKSHLGGKVPVAESSWEAVSVNWQTRYRILSLFITKIFPDSLYLLLSDIKAISSRVNSEENS